VANVSAYGSSIPIYTTWTAETVYSIGDYVVPTTPNDRLYECTVAGVSGAEEPTWDTEINSTTEDGTVIWTCRSSSAVINPLIVTLDTCNYGGLTLCEVWVKSDISATFDVYGSVDGDNWRWVDAITVPYNERTDRHQGYHNAYQHLKVITSDSGVNEIEIAAGA